MKTLTGFLTVLVCLVAFSLPALAGDWRTAPENVAMSKVLGASAKRSVAGGIRMVEAGDRLQKSKWKVVRGLGIGLTLLGGLRAAIGGAKGAAAGGFVGKDNVNTYNKD